MGTGARGLFTGLVMGLSLVGVILADGALANGALVSASSHAIPLVKGDRLTAPVRLIPPSDKSALLGERAQILPAPLPTLRGKRHIAAIMTGEFTPPPLAKPRVRDDTVAPAVVEDDVSAHMGDMFAGAVASAPARGGARRACFHCLLQRTARHNGVPYRLARAVVQIESGYDRWAVGGVGEIGLMQIRPQTASWLGFKGDAADLFNPRLNIEYGVRYLARAWRLAEGNLCGAILKDNAGHHAKQMNPISQRNCEKVQDWLRRGEGQVGPAQA